MLFEVEPLPRRAGRWEERGGRRTNVSRLKPSQFVCLWLLGTQGEASGYLVSGAELQRHTVSTEQTGCRTKDRFLVAQRLIDKTLPGDSGLAEDRKAAPIT